MSGASAKKGKKEGQSITRHPLPKAFENQILEFSAHMKMELGFGKNTASSYLSDIRCFAIYLKDEENASSFEDVDEDSLPNWLAKVSPNLSGNSQARRLSAVKCLSGFLMEEGIWNKNFCDFVSRPKTSSRIPEVLSEVEVEALIKTPNSTVFEGVRDIAMLEMMYAGGLRVSELCSVKHADIDFSEGIVRVRGKGEKTRLVPIGVPALNAIKRYLEFRATIKTTAAELFITKRAKKMSRKTFWYNITKYAAMCGIKKNVKPHMLRHSFATHMLSGGANLMSIREMLGHSDLSTTQIYTRLSNSRLAAQHEKSHPRSGMKVEKI